MLNQYNALFIITFIKLFIYIWHNLYTSCIASVTFHFFFMAGSWKGNLYKFYLLIWTWWLSDGWQAFLCFNVSWREYGTAEMTGLKTVISFRHGWRRQTAFCYNAAVVKMQRARQSSTHTEARRKPKNYHPLVLLCVNVWLRMRHLMIVFIIVSHAHHCLD